MSQKPAVLLLLTFFLAWRQSGVGFIMTIFLGLLSFIIMNVFILCFGWWIFNFQYNRNWVLGIFCTLPTAWHKWRGKTTWRSNNTKSILYAVIHFWKNLHAWEVQKKNDIIFGSLWKVFGLQACLALIIILTECLLDHPDTPILTEYFLLVLVTFALLTRRCQIFLVWYN